MGRETPYSKLLGGSVSVGQRGVVLTLLVIRVFLFFAPSVPATYLVLTRLAHVEHANAIEVTRLSVDAFLWGMGLALGGFTVKGGMEWVGRRGTVNMPAVQPPQQ